MPERDGLLRADGELLQALPAGSWAPTRIAWSYDNRTAGFRVVGDGPSLRIECRIPGADCNPYLAYAAAARRRARRHRAGASSRRPASRATSTPPRDLPRVPRTLRRGDRPVRRAAPFAEQAFGRTVVEHYAHFFRTEQDAYDGAVTDWERRRYFERI